MQKNKADNMSDDEKECYKNMSECRLNSKAWTCLLGGNHCRKKNRKWACIHELKCLYVFKQIEDKTGTIDHLSNELADDTDFSHIGEYEKNKEKARISSIEKKVFNINSLSKKKIKGLRVLENSSRATKLMFEKCKDWDKDTVNKEIRNLENRG